MKYREMIEVQRDKRYESADGWVMQREEGETPAGNQIGGRWVLRNEKGEMLDFDQYRNDLVSRFDLTLTSIREKSA